MKEKSPGKPVHLQVMPAAAKQLSITTPVARIIQLKPGERTEIPLDAGTQLELISLQVFNDAGTSNAALNASKYFIEAEIVGAQSIQLQLYAVQVGIRQEDLQTCYFFKRQGSFPAVSIHATEQLFFTLSAIYDEEPGIGFGILETQSRSLHDKQAG